MATKIDEIDARIAACDVDELARVGRCACDSLDRGAAPRTSHGGARRHWPTFCTCGTARPRDTLRQTSLAAPFPPGRTSCRFRPGHWPGTSLRARGRVPCRRWVAPRGASNGTTGRFVEPLRDSCSGSSTTSTTSSSSSTRSRWRGTGGSPELIVASLCPWQGNLDGSVSRTERASRRSGRPAPRRRRNGCERDGGLEDLLRTQPLPLAEWTQGGSRDQPLLARALRRLLEELPATDDGCRGPSGTRSRLSRPGSHPAGAFVVAQELEEAPFVGDAWFYRTLATLGSDRARLVETQSGEPLPPPPPLGDAHAFTSLPLRLTSRGTKVLAGEADRVELLGIDRWVGGTHLTPTRVWRWDAAAQQLIEPA